MVGGAPGRGTRNPPAAPLPNAAVAAATQTPPAFGSSACRAAPLFIEFRWVIAEPDGAVSELSLDSDAVTASSGASKVASGDDPSSRRTSGMVDITSWPVDTTSGAAASVQLPRDRVAGSESRG